MEPRVSSILSDKNLKRLFRLVMVVWIAGIGLSFALNWQQTENNMVEMATVEARSTFNKDLLHRRWATMHGGVYVPTTETTPPNPYLSHLPHRDVVTTAGQKLTLVNPAYMTRQVHELGQGQYGVRGHITSLNPLRPQNYPDPWEERALRSLETGIEETSSLEIIDDQLFMRFMRPMITEQGCLKCHEHQGYKVGDIRGGISVSVPYAPYQEIARQHEILLSSGHALIGVLGIVGILFGGRFILSSQSALHESEKRHRMAIRAAKDGIWEWDILTNQEYFSPQWCEIIGYAYDDPEFPHTFDSWSGRIHSADHERVMGALTDHLEKGGEYAVEYRHRHKSGEYRWQRSVGDTERDKNGQPIRMYGSISDISERKHAEEELRGEQSRLAEIIRGTNVGTWEWNVQTGEVNFNQRWAEIIGYTLEELEPLSIETWMQYVHPDDLTVSGALLEKHFNGELAHYETECRMKHKDDRWIWIMDRGKVSSWTAEGKPLLMFGTRTDISARKLAEQEHQRLKISTASAPWPVASPTTSTTFWPGCMATSLWPKPS